MGGMLRETRYPVNLLSRILLYSIFSTKKDKNILRVSEGVQASVTYLQGGYPGGRLTAGHARLITVLSSYFSVAGA